MNEHIPKPKRLSFQRKKKRRFAMTNTNPSFWKIPEAALWSRNTTGQPKKRIKNVLYAGISGALDQTILRDAKNYNALNVIRRFCKLNIYGFYFG